MKSNYCSSENRQYIKQMLSRGWKVYLYKKGEELIPSGVLWNIGPAAFVIKPKI